MPQIASFVEDCHNIRQRVPVIHNITNYVAMNFTANALLAAGASPVMSSEPAEIEEITASSDALVINLGCIEERQITAMERAAEVACRLGIPWVIDPVGAGLSGLRSRTALHLIDAFHPSAVRCNASEIISLCGASSSFRGVGSGDEVESAVEYAASFASEHGTVVSVSGARDIITDGQTVVRINNGSEMMPCVTAMGCTATALTGAFLAVDPDFLQAASNAMALMGIAGEKASLMSHGPGSLALNFIDTLYGLNPEEDSKLIRYE